MPFDFRKLVQKDNNVHRERDHERSVRPSLVAAGRHPGVSRVNYRGHNLPLHLLTRDFFITVVNLDTWILLLLVAGIYLAVFFLWSFIWWLVVRFNAGCLYGADNYVESLAFAIVTQMTIGYGNTGPQNCWAATWLICLQSIMAMLLEAVTLGIVFARISHPAQRAQSIYISDKGVIARRDGILKFMFRVADVRSTQVVEPKVKAYLYTWGEGRITAEGERIPVRVEPLEVDYIDGMLLLPLIIEHTIDERSPLCGHTLTSLLALNAEVIVTFEGTTEMGNPFMARRSYLPPELYWGHQFVDILSMPSDNNEQHYGVMLDRFHEVELQNEMPLLLPTQLSQLVVNRAKKTVPYPLLGENTLVLSDVLCVAPNAAGDLCLSCRVGDTYPNQMLELTARMYLFRWKEEEPGAPEAFEPFEQIPLQCGYKDGTDRLYLRLPVEVVHVIDDTSPLAAWKDVDGLSLDANSEIVVMINAYMHTGGGNRLRQRTYAVDHHVRYGYQFKPLVKPPRYARDRKPRVRWQYFHDVIPSLFFNDDQRREALVSDRPSSTFAQALQDPLSIAPESHAYLRSVASMTKRAPFALRAKSEANFMTLTEQEANDLTCIPMDLQRYAAAVGGADPSSPKAGAPTQSGSVFNAAGGDERAGDDEASSSQLFSLFPALKRYADGTLEASDSLPHPAALHPTLPGADRFRVSEDDAMRNDYTIVGMDLSRYAAVVGGDNSLPSIVGAKLQRKNSVKVMPSTSAEVEATGTPSSLLFEQQPLASVASASSPPRTSMQQDASGDIASGTFQESEDQEEGAGPIHFDDQAKNWTKDRALTNLFSTGDKSKAGKGKTPK